MERLLAGGRGLIHGVIHDLLTDAAKAAGSELVLDRGVDYEVEDLRVDD